MIRGSCLCGGVKFEVRGKIFMSRFCHCEYCRKLSGAGQAPWGLTRKRDFKQTVSAASVGSYDVGTGSQRVFCSACGSPLWFEPADLTEYIGIALGAIDEGGVEPPTMHVWMRSSQDWECVADDLPQHQTHP